MAQLSANELLASLGADKVAALLPYMKVLELPQETVLFETGDTVKAVYFPLSGIISIVVDLASGEMIEAAMIGKDGLVGGSAALDHPISLNRAVVQVAGAAATMPVDQFVNLCRTARRFGLNLPAMTNSCWRRHSKLQPVMPRTASRQDCHDGCCGATICSAATTFH